ncbi:MAG TPA: lipid-binding SYLF domain-containing protein [Stellaceae bacterium]|nr:lipid-binding SYLF domain-containing protein [Stellaceae bacterium]
MPQLLSLRGIAALLLAALAALLAPAGGARAQDAAAKSAALLRSADGTLRSFLQDPRWEALRNLLGGARAVFIVPHDVAGGFILTGSGGDGVLLRRHGNAWSDPVFMRIRSVGLGFEAGAERQSLVMVIMTDAGVDNLLRGVSEIGGSGGFALGNLGLSGGGSGGVSGGLQVLAVSTAKGLFGGTDIRSTELSTQDAYNQANYGPGYSMATIAAGYGGQVQAAADLRAVLTWAVNQSWGQ